MLQTEKKHNCLRSLWVFFSGSGTDDSGDFLKKIIETSKIAQKIEISFSFSFIELNCQIKRQIKIIKDCLIGVSRPTEQFEY